MVSGQSIRLIDIDTIAHLSFVPSNSASMTYLVGEEASEASLTGAIRADRTQQDNGLEFDTTSHKKSLGRTKTERCDRLYQ